MSRRGNGRGDAFAVIAAVVSLIVIVGVADALTRPSKVAAAGQTPGAPSVVPIHPRALHRSRARHRPNRP
jgi:hypothetical protein